MSVAEHIVSNARALLERDMKNIFDAQVLIASTNTYFEGRDLKKKVVKGRETIASRFPELYAHLVSHPYHVTLTASGCYVSMDVMKKLRFLDMKKLGNYRVYNRQVWGIIYNNALPDLRKNVSAELYDEIGAKLRKALSDKI